MWPLLINFQIKESFKFQKIILIFFAQNCHIVSWELLSLIEIERTFVLFEFTQDFTKKANIVIK